MSLRLNIDFGGLTQLSEDLASKLIEGARKAGAELAPAMHAHLLEQASEKLHSRRQTYIDNLSFKQENEDCWLITLNAKALWIENGKDPGEMIDDLLNGGKKPAKTAADGSKYKIIPFFHGPGKGGATSTPAQASLTQTIRKELNKAYNKNTGEQGIPYGKIEKGQDGKPLTGLLHSMDIKHSPLKTANGPGQGWGKIGNPKVGATGIPFLQGIRIYQRETKKPDGTSSVKRAIMTFRVVSSKHKGSGRWFHPGLAPVNLMDETLAWGYSEWDKLAPKILDHILGTL